MINVTFYHFSDGAPKGFCMKGHSGFSESGTDIICASVSSAAYLTANTILEVMKIDAFADVGDGYMKFTIPEKDKQSTKVILSGFELHLKELEKQYPLNVKIITEV